MRILQFYQKNKKKKVLHLHNILLLHLNLLIHHHLTPRALPPHLLRIQTQVKLKKNKNKNIIFHLKVYQMNTEMKCKVLNITTKNQK
jgi:hypothetical protein